MKVSQIDTSNLKTYEEFSRFGARIFDEIQTILNSGITFSDNFKAAFTSATFSSIDSEVAVSHGLSKIPTGYIIIGSTAALSVYDSGTANTDTNLYLKSNAVGTARLLVF